MGNMIFLQGLGVSVHYIVGSVIVRSYCMLGACTATQGV